MDLRRSYSHTNIHLIHINDFEILLWDAPLQILSSIFASELFVIVNKFTQTFNALFKHKGLLTLFYTDFKQISLPTQVAYR